MGQCEGQQGQCGFVGALVSGTLALDTAVILWHWSQGRGCRCHPAAAAGHWPMLCTSLSVPGMDSPMHNACAGVPGSATLSRPGVGSSSSANCCCPIRGNVLAALHHSRPWPCHAIATGCGGQTAPPVSTPGCSLAPAAAPSHCPHPCVPTLLPCGDHGDSWVSPAWPNSFTPTHSLGHSWHWMGPRELGTSWLRWGICTCQWPQSLGPYGWCILIFWVPARRGCRASCGSPGREGLQLQQDSVPSTFPAGAMGLINQMSMAGMGGTSLGMERQSQGPSLRHCGALSLLCQPGSGLTCSGGRP